jgi:hypothetical protein
MEALQIALKRMEPVAGQIHIGDNLRRIHTGQNAALLLRMLNIQAARVVFLKEALQTLVAKRTAHPVM